MIDPGKMDRLLRFQEDNGNRSTKTGQKVSDWQDIASPEEWAMVHSARGEEKFQSDKKTAIRRREFVIWYRADINEMMTVLYDDKRWDITSIEEIGRREGLSIEITWTQGKYNE